MGSCLSVSPSAVPACYGVCVLQKGQPHPGSVHQSQLLCSTVSGSSEYDGRLQHTCMQSTTLFVKRVTPFDVQAVIH